MLRNNPQAREMVRSPLFRQMMTNPEALRSAARIQRMMRGGSAGQGAFPMPGVTDNAPGEAGNNNNSNTAQNPAAGADIWGALGADAFGGNAPNPFGAFFNPFAMGQPGAGAGTAGAASTTQATGTPGAQATTDAASQGQANTAPNASNPPPNPFASLFGAPGADPNAGANPFGMPPMSPEALQQMAQLLGMGSPSGTPAPPDNRPPEERYAEQLRQLNDMGFYDFDRNVAALRRSGGSVQGAIEHLLSS